VAKGARLKERLVKGLKKDDTSESRDLQTVIKA
jgi:hypothetical protein